MIRIEERHLQFHANLVAVKETLQIEICIFGSKKARKRVTGRERKIKGERKKHIERKHI